MSEDWLYDILNCQDANEVAGLPEIDYILIGMGLYRQLRETFPPGAGNLVIWGSGERYARLRGRTPFVETDALPPGAFELVSKHELHARPTHILSRNNVVSYPPARFIRGISA